MMGFLAEAELLRGCVVFIFKTHDGAGALSYCNSFCYDSRAANLLSIKKQFLS